MISPRLHRSPRVVAGAAVAAAALLLSACSSSSDDTKKSDSAAAPASSGSSSSTAASALPSLDDLFKGLVGSPPTSSPAGAKGKTVWWVSCGSIAPDCAVPQAMAKEAAAKLGINFKTADGNLNQAGGYLSAFRTALAAKPDAIIVHALDCTAITPGLNDAKAAGIPVLGVETPDCDAPPVNKTALLTKDMMYSASIPDTQAYFKAWGKGAADYIIAKTDGKAQIINNEGTDAVFPLMNQGFTDEIKKCSGCKIVDTVKFTAAEQVPNGPWISRFRTSLTQHPTATATFIPSDYAMTALGGGKAVQDASLKMIVAGGSGSSAGMGGVSSGIITADTFAHDPGQMGYAAMDEINRMLQGMPTVPEGLETVVVDKTHNLPSGSNAAYKASIDWKAAYTKIWAAGK